MSMIYVKVVDQKGKEVDLKNLTDTGLTMVQHDLDEMKEEVEDLLSRKRR